MKYYYRDRQLDFNDIKTPKQFIEEWDIFKLYGYSDDDWAKKRFNWDNQKKIHKAFVEYWAKRFRDTINPVCMNNDDPKYYQQFCDFKLI